MGITFKVKAQRTGNKYYSLTLIIPKPIRDKLGIDNKQEFEADVDSKGRIIYTPIVKK